MSDLPAWCACPDDCDCNGEVVCGAPADHLTTIRCEEPPGHTGPHASGIRIGWGPRGRSIHRWKGGAR
jgi:hypothetical protein